jgi:hypothetical protein
MTEELSQDRQRLIRRYMESADVDEATADVALPDPWRQEAVVDPAPLVDLEAFATSPPRLDLVRGWISAVRYRHPQLRLPLVIIVLAVAVGWLVAHA